MMECFFYCQFPPTEGVGANAQIHSLFAIWNDSHLLDDEMVPYTFGGTIDIFISLYCSEVSFSVILVYYMT